MLVLFWKRSSRKKFFKKGLRACYANSRWKKICSGMQILHLVSNEAIAIGFYSVFSKMFWKLKNSFCWSRSLFLSMAELSRKWRENRDLFNSILTAHCNHEFRNLLTQHFALPWSQALWWRLPSDISCEEEMCWDHNLQCPCCYHILLFRVYDEYKFSHWSIYNRNISSALVKYCMTTKLFKNDMFKG